MLLAENISFRLLQSPLSSCVVSELVPISFGVFESFQGMYVHVENILLHQPTGLRCLNVLKDSQAV